MFDLTFSFVDLVREVHEATKLREDTLMARIRAFSDNFSQSQAMISSVSLVSFSCFFLLSTFTVTFLLTIFSIGCYNH